MSINQGDLSQYKYSLPSALQVQPAGQSLTFGTCCCCCCCCCCIKQTLEGLAFVFWHLVLGTISADPASKPNCRQMENSFPTADRRTQSVETTMLIEDT